MKLKVYQGDWFYNMGIIGFLNIIKSTDLEEKVTIKNNYIEFDSNDLEGFETIYFDYFMKQYNVAERSREYLINSLNYLMSHPERIKETVKRIREHIKKYADKVKKFDEVHFNEMTLLLQKIGKVKKIEELGVIECAIKQCNEIMSLSSINEKLSANLYKFIVGDNFFGQVSFFNVAKSSLGLEELRQTMYRDYLSAIIDYGKIHDFISEGNLEELKAFGDERLQDKLINKNVQKLLKQINKLLKKNDMGVLKDYLESDTHKRCEMCGEYSGIVGDYTEGHFAPLAVSSNNARNMFWNFNLEYGICDICKLILFCTPAGATYVKKTYIEHDEDEFYQFVNMDTSIKALCNNNVLLNSSRDKENPFNELIVNMISENEQKSRWQLENILFVEFKASIEAKKCTLNYFNMPTYLAKFFTQQNKKLSVIYNSKIKAAVIDYLLKDKDLKFLIYAKLREKIKDEFDQKKASIVSGNDCFNLVRVRYYINHYKKGGSKDVDDKKLKVIRYAGEEIRAQYIKDHAKNKLNGIAYRLLNTTKVGNKKDFMDTVLRIFATAQLDVPMLFLDVTAEKELKFEDIAYAFISGLLSDKYEAKNTVQEGK